MIISIGHATESEDLRDLPPPTIENLRWNIPPNDWRNKEEYFIKGKYFKIPSTAMIVETNKNGQKLWKLNIYEKSSMDSKPIFSIVNMRELHKDSKLICRLTTDEKPRYSNNYIKCEAGGCAKNLDKNVSNIVNNNYGFKIKMRGVELTECPYELDYLDVQNFSRTGEPSHTLFRFNKISPDKKSLEIYLNGKLSYVDIRNCDFDEKKKKHNYCGEVEYKYSKYEENWLNLKKTQRDESHNKLSAAIEYITPCLKKKDVKCVEKYIERSADQDPGFIETEITDEVFRELKACLNYKNLLPHLQASRGIKKACIFNMNGDGSGKLLLGVTYIEALANVGTLATSPIYLEIK